MYAAGSSSTVRRQIGEKREDDPRLRIPAGASSGRRPHQLSLDSLPGSRRCSHVAHAPHQPHVGRGNRPPGRTLLKAVRPSATLHFRRAIAAATHTATNLSPLPGSPTLCDGSSAGDPPRPRAAERSALEPCVPVDEQADRGDLAPAPRAAGGEQRSCKVRVPAVPQAHREGLHEVLERMAHRVPRDEIGVQRARRRQPPIR